MRIGFTAPHASSLPGQRSELIVLPPSPPPLAAARCDQAPPLTPAVVSGEWTEELTQPGTTYFVEPSNCLRGQVVVVTVTCDEGENQKGIVTRGRGGTCALLE